MAEERNALQSCTASSLRFSELKIRCCLLRISRVCLALNALLCAIASAVETYAVTLDTIKAVGTDRWTSASFSPFVCAPPLFLFSLTVSLPNPYSIIEYRANANLPPSLSEGIVITGIDANPEARAAIAKGGNFEASMAQDFKGIGSTVAEAVKRSLGGEVIKQSVMYVPTKLITAANVKD